MSDFDETMPLRPRAPLAGGGEAAGGPPKPAGVPADLVGRQLGDFRVLRRLGAGGMAEVFLAEQISLKRQVALKVMKEGIVKGDAPGEETLVRRFTQEATAAANLNHPHIVQVYAVGEAGGVRYIAQEYVPGQTMREWLRRNGPPDPATAIRLLRQVALALEAAAEAGVVHRDIKPENILLTKKGDAKVADFGLAQLTQAGERLHLTQIGLTMGTPLYMSPEQVAGKPVDHRSDLYSLGVTAYHLLAGRPPFKGETALSVAVQHLNTPAEPLETVRPDLPVALCQIVHKLMDKRPDRRYQTASDVAADLKSLGLTLKAAPAGAERKDLASFTVAKEAPAPHVAPLSGFFGWDVGRHAAALAAAAAVVAAVSFGTGWAARPTDPLGVPPSNEDVTKKPSAWAQYQEAIFQDTPEAWQAVLEHHPNDLTYAPLATLRLAMLRMKSGDFDEAERLFADLANGDDWARVNGQAGQAVLAMVRGRSGEFRRIVARLMSDRGERMNRNLDRDLRGLFFEAFLRDRAQETGPDPTGLEELIRQVEEGRDAGGAEPERPNAERR